MRVADTNIQAGYEGVGVKVQRHVKLEDAFVRDEFQPCFEGAHISDGHVEGLAVLKTKIFHVTQLSNDNINGKRATVQMAC